MSKNGNIPETLERLDEVLSIHGANPARWPEKDRDSLLALAERDARASRLVSEAAALDRLLDLAPAGRAGEALRNRIVASAVADGARAARVAPLSAARGNARKGFGDASSGTIWSATAMAACFALGLYLGVAGMGGSAIGSALDMASVDISEEEMESIDFFSDSGYTEPEGLI